MTVYIVTSKATDKDSSGVTLEVKVRCYGVFSSESRANDIAAKYSASVSEVVLDTERYPQSGPVLQSWVNPGYVD